MESMVRGWWLMPSTSMMVYFKEWLLVWYGWVCRWYHSYHVVSVNGKDVIWVAGHGDEAEAVTFSLDDIDYGKG